MGSNGLEASMWARMPGHHYVPRPGDWNCVFCAGANYAWRKECFRCSTSRDRALENREPLPAHHVPLAGLQQQENAGNQNGSHEVNGPGQLVQNVAGFPLGDNQPHSIHQTRQLAPRVASGNQSRLVQNADFVLADRLDPQKYGLATSRWAPRNYKRGSNGSEGPQIWTRTIQVAKRQPQTGNYPGHTTKPSDLGLPYEVQHYILNMIQRILEEGCFAFATRWVPEKMGEYGWSCPELVELSTWRKMLPELIPPHAITSGASLEQGLTNAVRIRHAAVHRHLCDNIEIQRMSLQAQKLMAMFGDVTREQKLYQLQLEVNDWVILSGGDPQAARNKLQSALEEISEKPVNDMDWTPNSVSLEEVGQEPVVDPPVAEIGSVDEYFGAGDEMELD